MVGIIQPETGQAAQQREYGDFGLYARELRAEAKMDPAAERQRPYVGALDIEPVRFGIDGRVAIGRAEQAEYALALLHLDAAEFGVGKGHASGQLHGRIESQEFLYGIADARGLGAQQMQLLHIAIERQQPIADEIHRGLMPGAEQKDDVGSQLLIRQLAAFLFGLHQLAGEIIAWLAAAQIE